MYAKKPQKDSKCYRTTNSHTYTHRVVFKGQHPLTNKRRVLTEKSPAKKLNIEKSENMLYVGVEMCPYVNIRLKSYPKSELWNHTKQANVQKYTRAYLVMYFCL